MEIKKVTVNINGNDYILKTDYSEDYIRELVHHVNEIISSITENYSKLPTQMKYVLTALNMADELFISNEENKSLKKEIEKLKSDINDKDKKISNLEDKVKNLYESLHESKKELEEYIKTFDDTK